MIVKKLEKYLRVMKCGFIHSYLLQCPEYTCATTRSNSHYLRIVLANNIEPISQDI
jgi:hypothetical protein